MNLNQPIPKKAKKPVHGSQPPPSFDLNAPIPKIKKAIPSKPNSNASNRPGPSSSSKKGTNVDLDMPIPRQKKSTKIRLRVENSSLTKMNNSQLNKVPIPCHRQSKPLEFPPGSHITLLSESPFILRINTKGMSTKMRSSGRSNKRKSYTEKETDSDFLETDSEDEAKSKQMTKRLKKGIKTGSVNGSQQDGKVEVAADANAVISYEVEPPPTGVLPSLWYSRENCIHVWVIEKIIGWKKRPKVEMEWKDEKIYELDRDTSRKVQDKLINAHITNAKTRMEISRISPRKCPLVLKAIAEREERMAKKEQRNPECSITPNTTHEKEEILLIKWRGRSYIHCSWERASDLERLDPTNNTAKGKIKRYYQSQYTALGMNWKRVLEERRMATATGHGHGLRAVQVDHKINDLEEDDEALDEDFFPPDNVEIERIMACDENELDMNVLVKQRALNFKNEEEAEQSRQKELFGGQQHIDKSLRDENIMDESWDPEDYVRYVVKWKGLQVSEITWEYWLHIKHNSVDQAEDFWLRQRPKIDNSVELAGKGRPHMREYKKLVESPSFGISSTKRPTAELSDERNSVGNCDDEESPAVVLRLRNYQLEGVNWLLWNWWNSRSCILADEMGLGKTIQSMCFLDQLQKLPAAKVRGPFLVVAPLSLVNQWQSEARTWAPDMNLLLYHGSMDARSFLVDQEFHYSDQFVPKATAQKLKRLHFTKFHVLITTYEVVMKDINVLSKIRWKALIVDEAHRLKNDQSRLFRELGNVPREFCLLLTGTPLQNSTEELWSLLHFCDPLTFASKDDFVNKFGQLSGSKQVSDLHGVLKPFLLRRVKEDVEKSLPPKEETILEVALTPIQKKYYKAIYERNTSFLFKGSKPSNAPSLMNIMMELRKCCNHPFLIKGAEDRIMQEAASEDKKEEKPDPVVRYRRLLADQLVKSSGKMVLLMKLLPKLQSGGHKVLIFSQMVRVLDLLEELLKLNAYSYERLDGSTGAASRAAAVDRFNKKSYGRFIMLLSTRAGGLGLNLTSADTVIIFDSDWNPQNDLQAMARAHRIGQTRSVRVYRLLTAKTYEMHMFHSASMKLGLDRAVLAHQRQQDDDKQDPSKKKSKESQAKEIDELLKKGAYDVFQDKDDSEAKKFMETDIDQLLERSSRTVTYGNTQSKISSGLGSFSKASFVTSDADGKDIDLDDPDFWAKAVGLDAPITPLDENILLEGEKRSRKQVQVFDPYAAFQEEEDKKKEKADMKAKFEKEERNRVKKEQKLKREQEKERKKKDKEEALLLKTKALLMPMKKSEKSTKMKETNAELSMKSEEIKLTRELQTKKIQRAEQRKVMRSTEQNDPIVKRMKQGWDDSHRDRVISAIHLYGFGRFCKVRDETNLLSLPIQDIEHFSRAYVFQLGLQASVSLLQEQQDSDYVVSKLRDTMNTADGKWVVHSIMTAMMHYDSCSEQELRIPITLNEPGFIATLRGGNALSALKNLSFMNRLNSIIEQGAEEIFNALGQEELGKRGYYSKDSSSLDIDLKMRHLTTEELSHAIGRRLSCSWKMTELSRQKPAPWWDRECDLGLILGTFLHGLNNYEAMVLDNSLPFAKKLQNFEGDHSSSQYEMLRLALGAINSVGETIIKLEAQKSIAIEQTEQLKATNGDEAMTTETVLNTESKDHNYTGGPPKTISKMKATCAKLCESNVGKIALSGVCKAMQKSVINALTADLQGASIQDACISALAYASDALDDRIFQLVTLVENTDPNAIVYPTIRNSNHTNSNHFIFTALCNDLGLTERTHLRQRGPRPIFDVGPEHPELIAGTGLPTSLSRYGLIGLAYMNEKTAALVSDDCRITKGNPNLVINQKHQVNDIHVALKDNEILRNAICAAMLYFGTVESQEFMPTLLRLTGTKVPLSHDDVKEYVEKSLLPHCALLCIFGVKKDHREYLKQAIYKEVIIIPDPAVPLSGHSWSSVDLALSVLRRVKLYEAIRSIVHLPGDEIKDVVKNVSISMDSFPIWWTTDFSYKLFHHSAHNGLLCASLQKSCFDNTTNIFHLDSVKRQLKQKIFQGSERVKPLIPPHVSKRFTKEDMNDMIERQVCNFPSALAIEMLLAEISMLVSCRHKEKSWAFISFPMEDHALFQA